MPIHLHEEEDRVPHVSVGSGVPAVTPSKIGDLYVDTLNKHLYWAAGTTNSGDWENLSV